MMSQRRQRGGAAGLGLAAAVALTALAASTPVRAQVKGVISDTKQAEIETGKRLDVWAEEWWTWVAGIPGADNPLLDETGERCDVNQGELVWFLASALNGTFYRECVVPPDRYLFFPIISRAPFESVAADEAGVDAGRVPEADANAGAGAGNDALCPGCQQLCEVAEAEMNDPSVLTCAVDGDEIESLLELHRVRREAPGCFVAWLPNDNIFGFPEGSYCFCQDGYWVLLEPLEPGPHVIRFTGQSADGQSIEVTYDLTVLGGEPIFHRGDANGDGTVNISDPQSMLINLFLGGPATQCRDAADSNDDRGLDVSDALYTLNFLFQGGPPPPTPGAGQSVPCGPDPGGPDEHLGCESYTACEVTAQ